MPLRAVIFDLDGTLVDSEVVWTEGLSRWLSAHGKTYEPAFQKQLMGKPAAICVQMLTERYGLEGDVATLEQERRRFFEGALADMGFIEKPGACALIRALQADGVLVGLATSADHDYAERALAAINCRDCFVAVTTGDEIIHGKPAPDIYLTAATKMGVAPAEAVAVEDAPSGVESARAAGMKVVGVADPRYIEALPGATLEISSLKNLTVDQLRTLF